MKKLVHTLAIVLTALPCLAQAQSVFEGLIVYRIEANGKGLLQKSWVRGDSIMIEAEPPMPVKSVVNFATQEYRVYTDANNFQKYPPVKAFDAKPNPTSHLKELQQFDTIHGIHTQLYQVGITVADKGQVLISFWLTKDLPDATRLALVRNLLIGSTDQAFRDIAHEILALGLAPINLSVSIGGKTQSSMTVVSATEQKIPNEKFAGF